MQVQAPQCLIGTVATACLRRWSLDEGAPQAACVPLTRAPAYRIPPTESSLGPLSAASRKTQQQQQQQQQQEEKQQRRREQQQEQQRQESGGSSSSRDEKQQHRHQGKPGSDESKYWRFMGLKINKEDLITITLALAISYGIRWWVQSPAGNARAGPPAPQHPTRSAAPRRAPIYLFRRLWMSSQTCAVVIVSGTVSRTTLAAAVPCTATFLSSADLVPLHRVVLVLLHPPGMCLLRCCHVAEPAAPAPCTPPPGLWPSPASSHPCPCTPPWTWATA